MTLKELLNLINKDCDAQIVIIEVSKDGSEISRKAYYDLTDLMDSINSDDVDDLIHYIDYKIIGLNIYSEEEIDYDYDELPYTLGLNSFLIITIRKE